MICWVKSCHSVFGTNTAVSTTVTSRVASEAGRSRHARLA